MLLIGDVHGKFDAYRKIIKGAKASIQVGDMGVGFIRTNFIDDEQYLTKPPRNAMLPGHRFIRGNHDNPIICRWHSQYIPDGYIDGDTMFVGGAYSIDKAYRTEGIDWWSEEELSVNEFNFAVDDYTKTKPKAMITHDCPEEIIKLIHSHHYFDKPSRTSQALQSMWSAHSPEIWIFGHHHTSFDQVANGTRFVCLAELEAKEFDIPLENIANYSGEELKQAG